MSDAFKVIAGAAVVRHADGEQMFLRGQVFRGGDFDSASVKRLLHTGLVAKVEVVAESQGPVMFDPSKHTAEEVLAELESVADDSDEVARIRQAERDGKNRQTLTKMWDKADADAPAAEQN